MAVDACCEDIIEVKGRVSTLETSFETYKEDAQRWRDQHEARNEVQTAELKALLRGIETKLTTFVNPVLAVVITVLGTIIGVLLGILSAMQG